MAVPLLMAFQNWDDHDRSNRYTAQSLSRAYLQSIQEDKGAIILQLVTMTPLLYGMLKILKDTEQM